MGRVTFRNRNDSMTAALFKSYPGTGDPNWKPGAHCVACRQLGRLKSMSLMELSWSESCLHLSAVLTAYIGM